MAVKISEGGSVLQMKASACAASAGRFGPGAGHDDLQIGQQIAQGGEMIKFREAGQFPVENEAFRLLRDALIDQGGMIGGLKDQRRVEACFQHQAQRRTQIRIVISQQEAFHTFHLLPVYALAMKLSLPGGGVFTWSSD